MRNFVRVATLEATTYLVLVAAMLIRITLDGPNLSPVLGPIHGFVYVAYVIACFQVRTVLGWSWARTLVAVVAGAIPFGGFVEAKQVRESSEQA